MAKPAKVVVSALSGIWGQIKLTAGSIAEASIASATAAVRQLKSRHDMIALFNACGEAAQPLLAEPDSDVRLAHVTAFMQGAYTQTLDEAREVGKREHKRQVKAGLEPVLTQTAMGKSSRKGVSNRRVDMENFTECILSDDHRAAALAMATPYADPPIAGEPSWEERSAVFFAPRREAIMASDLVVNVGLEAPYTETSPLHYITVNVGDLPQRKRSKFVYAALSYCAGDTEETVEVRLTTMPLSEVFTRLEGDAAKSSRYVTRCKAAKRGIVADFVPDGLHIVYEASK